ncbi:MAG: single-stranded-DNA-specific exonuclease RecJ [Firmicutes bacterium]|nr:single-stranded-DNA-specific exonuclease RecJ [Bacillota bacterium]
MSKWMLRQTSADPTELAKAAGISPFLAHILAVRGYRDAKEMQKFLHTGQQQLADCSLFADFPLALDHLIDAIDEGKRIVIFGDYDVDGVMSTCILHKALSAVDANVSYYIPQRESEGYGMNNAAIARLAEDGAEVLLACDNGISAIEQVEYAKQLGLSVLIIDHHEPMLVDNGAGEMVQQLPAADAVCDPKRSDCRYPFKLYCAGGLCYRFAMELFSLLGFSDSELENELLAMATIATVCDLVELTDDNRWLVQRGLPLIGKVQSPGLLAILENRELLGKNITAHHIGYQIGPCINAFGRLEDASMAVELLLTDDPHRAYSLSEEMARLNNQRKSLTEQGAILAFSQILEENLDQDDVLVVYEPLIHESVAGIIAGRIKERYYKPSIVIAGEKDVVHGSCRSIEGYNIFAGLSTCADLLEAFGGHPLAAGLTVDKHKIADVRRRLNADYRQQAPDIEQLIRIDKQLPLATVNLALAEQLQQFEPFGKGNPPINFAEKNVCISKIVQMGSSKKAMRWSCRGATLSKTVEAVCFESRDKLDKLLSSRYGEGIFDLLLQNAAEVYLDLIYNVNINEFNGRRSAQVQIVDYRLSAQ